MQANPQATFELRGLTTLLAAMLGRAEDHTKQGIAISWQIFKYLVGAGCDAESRSAVNRKGSLRNTRPVLASMASLSARTVPLLASATRIVTDGDICCQQYCQAIHLLGSERVAQRVLAFNAYLMSSISGGFPCLCLPVDRPPTRLSKLRIPCL